MEFTFVTILLLVLIPVLAGIVIITVVLLLLRQRGGAKAVPPEKAENRKPLGEVLKAHRCRCGMTQEFVAQKLGVSRQAVSKWELGASDPSTANLFALAELFGINAEQLLNGDGQGR